MCTSNFRCTNGIYFPRDLKGDFTGLSEGGVRFTAKKNERTCLLQVDSVGGRCNARAVNSTGNLFRAHPGLKFRFIVLCALQLQILYNQILHINSSRLLVRAVRTTVFCAVRSNIEKTWENVKVHCKKLCTPRKQQHAHYMPPFDTQR